MKEYKKKLEYIRPEIEVVAIIEESPICDMSNNISDTPLVDDPILCSPMRGVYDPWGFDDEE